MKQDLTIRNFVSNLLIKFPKAKDDYNYLTAISYLLQERKLASLGINLEKTQDFLTAISKGSFFSIESISREKRFQLEHFEHLRTPTWYANQDREVIYIDEIRTKASIERQKLYLKGEITIKDLAKFVEDKKKAIEYKEVA